MRRRNVAMQECYSHALNRSRAKPLDGLDHAGLVEGAEDLAVRSDTFDDGDPPIAWDKRRLFHQVDIILVEPALRAELNGVAKSLRGEQCRARARSFYECIGCKRRSVNDDGGGTGTQARFVQDFLDSGSNAALRCIGRGQNLRGPLPAALLNDEVSERAPNVDRNSSPDEWRRAHPSR